MLHLAASVSVMNEQMPCFIDFEASSLSDHSYPIEVAWSMPDGSIESHLIKPAWDWTEWSEAAEKIHGISRKQLQDKGEFAWIVAERMNERLSGIAKIIYCDAPAFDGFWLQRLFEHHRDEPAFRLAHAEDDLLSKTFDPNDLVKYKSAARRVCSPAHRAAADVAYLIELYRLVRTAGKIDENVRERRVRYARNDS